jgi:hypothetical protein
VNDLEQADNEYEQSLDVPPSPYIWLMDSDFCQNCGTELADVDGYCWWCWEQLEDEERQDDDVDDGYDAEADMKREYEIALREGGYYICFPEKEQEVSA